MTEFTVAPWAPPTGPAVTPRAGHRATFVRLLVAAGVVILALLLDSGSALVVPALFVLVVPFEKLFPRHRQRLRRPGVATDIAYALSQPVLALVGAAVAIVVGVVSLAWVPGLALRPLIGAMPSGLRALAGIVLFDMLAYWAHRWSHEVPFLWRFHAIHHSTERLDWVSGFRGHPADGALVAPPFVFLLAAGFDVQFAGVLAVIQLVTGLFLHANVRWRWRPLHRVVITPEFHHWHHADEPDAHNTNYSIFLPLWDLAFGTYFMPSDRRPSVYGVGGTVPDGMFEQLRHPLRGLHPPRWILRHPLGELRHLIAAVRRGLGQVAASTRRRPRRPSAPGRRP